MLWWDDNVGKTKKETPLSNSIVLESDEISKCFRNTGAVPIPRKVSKSYNVPLRRKISAPENVKTEPQPPLARRKISCPPPRTAPPPARTRTPPPPPPQQLKLFSAFQDTLDEFLSDEVADLKVEKVKTVIFKISTQPASPASLFIKGVPKPKLILATEKAKITEPDVKKELKRGSMKEKWGLSLVYRMDNSRIELAVNKVAMFSPAAKAGMQRGDTILLINDWKVEAMDQIQAVLSIFLAAGFSVNLGWSKSSLCLEGWGVLENI